MQMFNKWISKFKFSVKTKLTKLTLPCGFRTLQTITSTLRTDSIKTKWSGGELASTTFSNVNATKLESKSSQHGCHNTMKRLRPNLTFGVFIEGNLKKFIKLKSYFFIPLKICFHFHLFYNLSSQSIWGFYFKHKCIVIFNKILIRHN